MSQQNVLEAINNGDIINKNMIMDVICHPEDLRKVLVKMKKPLRQIDQNFVLEAAVFDNAPLESFEILLYAGWSLSPLLCHQAGRAGRLDILKFAFENGCLLDTTIPYVYGQFEANFVSFIITGTNLDPSSDILLECLEYAIQNGCILRKEFCEQAAEMGKVDILKFLIENDYRPCPWEYEAVVNAGTMSVLEYILTFTPGVFCGERGYRCQKSGCERCDNYSLRRLTEESDEDGLNLEELEEVSIDDGFDDVFVRPRSYTNP
jgi:hypothetical protein